MNFDVITQVGPSWRGSGFSALHFPTFELAGFPISRHQVSVMGATLDHRIIASYGLIAPLVTMSCRLLLRRVASPGVLPRERFSCVLGMFSSLEVKVLYPT